MIAASKHSDFGDWLSPMLVKELRQGMRSRVFVAAFYLTQLLMILNVILSLIAISSMDIVTGMSSFLSGLFWVMIGIPLLVVMPVRGFGALHGEMKARTLELIFLTHLSAWRIVLGKWAALMVQTLLLLCSVLPYVVLRYFLGGVNIVEDLQIVFFLLIGSATFTAVTIALSPYESKVLRGLFVMGFVFALFFLPSLLTALLGVSGVFGTRGTSMTAGQIYLALALFLPAFILLALEMGASRIAPPAENHALRKRLIGFYFLLAAAVFIYFGAHAVWVFSVALFLLFFVVVDALAEPLRPVRRIYAPFLRFGFFGRVLACVLTPGWASAIWYVTALGILGGVLLAGQGQLDGQKASLPYLAYFGTLIMPAALIRLFRPATRNFLGSYLALQIFFLVVTILFSMTLGGAARHSPALWLSPIPLSVFLLNLFGQVKEEFLPLVWMTTMIVVLLSLLVLLLRSLAPWRDIRAMLRQSSEADVQR